MAFVLKLIAGLAVVAFAPVGFVLFQSLGRSVLTTTAPRLPVAIVFGAEIYRSGQPSPYLQARLDIAYSLYTSKLVKAILVSGDNRAVDYNEPEAMRNYLIAKGVPAEKVIADYAGVDTYSTCVRAQQVFGIRSALLVTQSYHLPRALATCRTVGVDAWGVGDVSVRNFSQEWVKDSAREWLADGKLVLDLLTRRVPTLGPRETSVENAVQS